MRDDDNRTLLLGTHRGERDAAVRLYRTMAPRLLAYARSLVGDDAAEDAVQQVFVKLLGLGRDEIERVEDVLPWLIRLTRNAVLNDARGNGRRRVREAEWGGMSGASPFRLLATREHDGLLAALGEIDAAGRELIVLKHIAGLSFDQMAASLDENRSTLASRYRAAIERLRSVLSIGGAGVHHG